VLPGEWMKLETAVRRLFLTLGGCRTAGVTTEEQLLSPDNSIHPDYYADSLAALLEVKQLQTAAA